MSKSIRDLLREFDIRPRKDLGQNFLVDPLALQRIVDAAEVQPEDIVLEIGPGLGTLTEALARRASEVVAVEVDERMVAVLHRQLAGCTNVRIVVGDILDLQLDDILSSERDRRIDRFKVVANIPYYITSAVLRYLLEAPVRPQLIVLTVQREVAERIMARPGEMSLLAVSVQFYGVPSVAARIPAQSFYPAPRVDSAVIRIVPHATLPLHKDEIDGFFGVVRAGFAQRRKQLRNSLAHGLRLDDETVLEALRVAGIDAQRRAQTLSIDEWVSLYRAIKRA